MAFEVISTDVTTTYSVDDNDIVTLLEGVNVTSPAAAFNPNPGADTLLTNVELRLFGLVSGGTVGIDFWTGLSEVQTVSVTIGATGIVAGSFYGIRFDDVRDVYVRNAGYISGEIKGIETATHQGIFSLSNSGIIEGLYRHAIDFGSGTRLAIIENTGVIRGAGISNGETIKSNTPLKLYNSGDIIATNFTAVQSSNLSDLVVNSGQIYGNVSLGNSADQYEGQQSGFVRGTVSGEGGNDVLRGSDAVDILSGGADNDRLVGRGGDDFLLGGTEDDTITGGDGNDEIAAGDHADQANGNAGDDKIRGETGDDNLRGGRDDDIVNGGDGDDTLRGDSGDDVIIGGAGRDNMFGGSGQDVFIFESLSDSGTGAARDRIFDFRSGQDQLDIGSLAGPAFVYLGASNFTGTGKPEVRAVNLPNGTLVYIDADGDGARDSDIYLIGTASVTEGDFLL